MDFDVFAIFLIFLGVGIGCGVFWPVKHLALLILKWIFGIGGGVFAGLMIFAMLAQHYVIGCLIVLAGLLLGARLGYGICSLIRDRVARVVDKGQEAKADID